MTFEMLRQIRKENAALQTAADRAAPRDCPFDGSPLAVRADGVRNCPWGDYRWKPGDPR